MFRNSGAKLRVTAKVLFVIGVLAALTAAILVWAKGAEHALWIGLGIMIGGLLACWVGTLALHALADAALAAKPEDVDGTVREHLTRIDKKLTAVMDELDKLEKPAKDKNKEKK